MNYVERMELVGITLVGGYTRAKDYHIMRCNTCGNEWEATPISKWQAYQKYNQNGCPRCYNERRTEVFIQKRNQTIATIEERFEILSEYNGHQVTTQSITVRNRNCGHVFETAPGNIIHREIECPVCNVEKKRQTLKGCNDERSRIYRETADEWGIYRHEVYRLTRISYKHHKNTINPHNLPRGKAGQDGAYHLDHIVPVRYCFEHNIPAEVCAHFENLQMIPWSQNITNSGKLKEGIRVPHVFEGFVNRLTK